MRLAGLYLDQAHLPASALQGGTPSNRKRGPKPPSFHLNISRPNTRTKYNAHIKM